MSEYLTAEQARNNMLEAQSLNGSYKKEETEKILAAILKAAQLGHSSVTLGNAAAADLIIAGRLKSLGYEVKMTSDQRDGPYMTINW